MFPCNPMCFHVVPCVSMGVFPCIFPYISMCSHIFPCIPMCSHVFFPVFPYISMYFPMFPCVYGLPRVGSRRRKQLLPHKPHLSAKMVLASACPSFLEHFWFVSPLGSARGAVPVPW